MGGGGIVAKEVEKFVDDTKEIYILDSWSGRETRSLFRIFPEKISCTKPLSLSASDGWRNYDSLLKLGLSRTASFQHSIWIIERQSIGARTCDGYGARVLGTTVGA